MSGDSETSRKEKPVIKNRPNCQRKRKSREQSLFIENDDHGRNNNNNNNRVGYVHDRRPINNNKKKKRLFYTGTLASTDDRSLRAPGLPYTPTRLDSRFSVTGYPLSVTAVVRLRAPRVLSSGATKKHVFPDGCATAVVTVRDLYDYGPHFEVRTRSVETSDERALLINGLNEDTRDNS